MLILPGGSEPVVYEISRSLRFNSADSAYLNRTFSSPTDNKKWVWSGWFKRGRLGTYQVIFGAGNDSNTVYAYAGFDASDRLDFFSFNTVATFRLTSSAAYRDPTAWYHIVFICDTANSTAANRAQVWVNGTRVTAFATETLPSLNAAVLFNDPAQEQTIGLDKTEIYNTFLDGYLTEVYFIDGQALTPSSFGATTTTTGAWDPKTYTGTYGTNGFYLNFADNTNTTAATLGADDSGNGNNWTPNNFSVTAGVGNDSLVDTPTNYGSDTGVGGGVRGNYCVLNSLANPAWAASPTLSNGNLDCSQTLTQVGVGSFAMSSGKWSFEWVCNSGINGIPQIGISNAPLGTITTNGPGQSANAWVYVSNGTKSNNSSFAGYGASYTTGDIVGVTFDASTGELTFYKNGLSQGSAFTGLTSGPYFPIQGNSGGTPTSGSFNFGQRPFAYTAPSGFRALCTKSMSEGSITTSGSFTGNALVDGPMVWLNGTPTTMTINSNPVTFGTDADRLAGGFKVRTSSSSYNTSGSNTYSVSATGSKFKYARAQANS